MPQLTSRYAAARSRRVFPIREIFSEGDWNQAQPGLWPARWVKHGRAGAAPVVAAYRLKFHLTAAQTCRVHVSADERYEGFLNGESISVGPERGDAENWAFETYEWSFDPGDHCLVFRVWSLGEKAPVAQMSLGHGLLVCPERREFLNQFATGIAPWQGKILKGYEWQSPLGAWGTGWNLQINGDAFDWGHEAGDGDRWESLVSGEYGDHAKGVRMVNLQPESGPLHRLRAAQLPPQKRERIFSGVVRHLSSFEQRPVGRRPVLEKENLKEEISLWSEFIRGKGAVCIPAFSRRRVIIDLQNYFCLYSSLRTSGGAERLD